MSFASDTFTDTDAVLLQNHAGELGATWTKGPNWSASSIKIKTNRIRGNASGANVYYASGVPASADYTVEADYVTLDASPTQAGVMAHMVTSGSDYFVWGQWDAGYWRIYQRVNGGGATVIGNQVSHTPQSGHTYHITLQLVGTAVTMTVTDGETTIAVCTATTSVTNAGRAGLECTNAPGDTTGARLDNFAATDYGVPDELTPGTVSATARGTTTASLSSTDASGGTPPYAYQWHRSTENDFTPIPATALSGETSLTLDDTGLHRATTYHWKLVYTDDEDETATSTQATLTTAQSRCVCDGNSLTSGGGETPYYPTQLADLLGTPWVVNNKGVTSQTTLQMSADATTDIDPLYEAENTKNVLVAWEGTNHVYFNATASAAITALFNYCTARRAAGFKVVLLTLLPRGDFPGSSTLPDPKEENHEDRRAVVNMWIRQTWDSCADALADVAADERIGLDGCEDDTTYYMADKVHMKSAGYAIIADIVYDAIQNLPTEPPAETTNLIALIPSAGAETQFTDTPRTPGTYHYVGTPVQQRRGVGRSERRHRSDNPLTNDPPQTWSNRHGHLARRTRSRHEDERRTRRSHARPRRKRRRPAAPRNRPASREHLARRSGARRRATRRRPRKPSPTRRRALRADPDQPGAPTLKIRRLTSARAERSKDTSHPRETQQAQRQGLSQLNKSDP